MCVYTYTHMCIYMCVCLCVLYMHIIYVYVYTCISACVRFSVTASVRKKFGQFVYRSVTSRFGCGSWPESEINFIFPLLRNLVRLDSVKLMHKQCKSIYIICNIQYKVRNTYYVQRSIIYARRTCILKVKNIHTILTYHTHMPLSKIFVHTVYFQFIF